MIVYLEHDKIDKAKWDDCISNAVNGLVYAWSWYLDVVHPEWDALVEMDNDKYLSVMPITRKKKYAINYLCQPFFAQQLGVFSLNPIAEGTTLSFINAIPRKYVLIEIRLNELNPLPEGSKRVGFHKNHLLDLRFDYNSLSSKYHENTIRNLKKSFKYNLEPVPLDDLQPIIHLFRENRGAAIRHWGDAEYGRLEQLSSIAKSSSNAFIYGVKHPEYKEIICGALFLISNRRITFLFSGNNEIGKTCQAMTFLLDRVIKEYALSEFTLDFEGSDDPNLARFYQGFGSSAVLYPSYTFRLL